MKAADEILKAMGLDGTKPISKLTMSESFLVALINKSQKDQSIGALNDSGWQHNATEERNMEIHK